MKKLCSWLTSPARYSWPGALVLLLLTCAGPAPAQTPAAGRAAPPTAPGSFLLLDVRRGATPPPVADRQRVLRDALTLTPADDLRLLRTETDELGFVHERYQPYYQGVKVEHATISLHTRGGKIETLSGDYQRPLAALSARPALAESAALQRALAAVGARRYMWQIPDEEVALKKQTNNPRATYQPTGELVWVGDFRQPEATRPIVLAWKFNVYAAAPVSRAWVYVDARTGQPVLRDAIIKHVNAPGATFATRYAGARTSITDNTGSGYRLRETATGRGVTTLNLRKSTTLSTAVDFTDNDNNWTAAEHDNANFDNAAFDAHLGAQATQGYWNTIHGRDSYDDRGTVLLSYVHYGNAVDNAFWNGTAMLYGDGSTIFKPLTSIDVCGHEVGHAVCQATANLVYQGESGALNEGFSDIWGCAVENFFDPAKQVYLIGEDITRSPRVALRSMSNPNAFNQPDTYLGTNWRPTAVGQPDNGGVHTNSGVLNFWFYLLSAGGSGANDFGTSYNVTGISIAKAERIAYRAERLYMTTTTNHNAARKATMQAAIDLFGLSSAEATATAQAWRAVGVGDGTGNTEGAPTLTSFAATSGVPGTVVTLTGTNIGAAFRVTFNGTAATLATLASGTQLTVTVPNGATTGPISITTTSGTATSASNFTITSAGPAPVISSYAPAGGQAQGGSVTITGTNLGGATAVAFNGTSATGSITANSATSLTVTVPAGATSGPLTVTTANGTATAPTTFLVLPNITSFTASSGVAGASIVITGTSFTGALNVKFNGTYATSFVVNSATQVTAVVAAGSTTGPISIRTASGTATSATNFTLTPSLSFDSFSPTSAAVGAVVTLRGRGFTGTTAVTFGGVSAPTFTVASDLELWATVPVGALSGTIGLTTPLGPASSPSAFTVIVPGAPTIASFTPTSGPAGTAVTLTGTNFTGVSSVTFNGTAATFLFVNATTINTTVPVGATTGPISVTTPVNTVFSSTSFILPPTNDLCANTGLPVLTCGATVTGTTVGTTATGDPTGTCGAAVSAAAGGVFYRFVGTGGAVTVTTCAAATNFDTQLFVYSGTCGSYVCVGGNDDLTTNCFANNSTLPSEVTFTSVAGTNYFIFVNGFGGGQGSFGLTATCVGVTPTITGFTPTSGPVGTSVGITGTNFTAASAVTFDGTAATTFTVNSSTSITATVPTGATTGPIGVTGPGGTGVSGADFTVIAAPTLTSILPTSGPVGTSVTLTGTDFTGATGVSFNGTAAVTFGVTNATTATATVPAGATSGNVTITTVNGTSNGVPFVVTAPQLAVSQGATGYPSNGAAYAFGNQIVNTSGAAVSFTLANAGTAALAISSITTTGNFATSGTLPTTVAAAGSAPVSVVFTPTAAGARPGTLVIVSTLGTYTVNLTGNGTIAGPVLTNLSATSGLVGSTLILTGSDLSGATSVSFNGTPQTTISANSATSLTVTVPIGATTGPVTVTTPGGTSNGLPFTITSPSLTISTGSVGSPVAIAAGTYDNITVMGPGFGQLAGAVVVNGTFQVMGSLDTNCQPLTGAGSFTLAAGATLGICDPAGIAASGATGAVQTNGSRAFSTDANYRYNGIAAQASGGGLPAQVRNLSTTNSNALTLSAPTSVAQVLTVGGAGNLVLGGNALTLLSSAAGTALAVNSSTGVVVGTATVQRFIDPSLNAGAGYRHFSAPVSNTTVADLATAGFAPEVSQASVYNASATPGTTTPFPTVFGYDQSRVTLVNSYTPFDRGFAVPATLGTPLAVGRGYAVNTPASPLVDFVGTLTTGDQTPLALSRVAGNPDAGWQLLGNPYPAPLDYSLVAAGDRTGLDAAIYVYSSTGPYVGQYRSYVSGIGNAVLPVAQGFFVRVSAGQTSGSLTFRNSQRLTVPQGTAFQRSTTDPRPLVQLELAGTSGPADALALYAEAGATPGFDRAFDAAKLPNPSGLNLAALATTGEALAIDGRPGFGSATRVPLSVAVPALGSYTLSATALANLSSTRAELVDNLTGTRTVLTAGASYRFGMSSFTAPGRFWLNLTPAAGPLATAAQALEAQVLTYPNPTHGTLTVLRPLGVKVTAATLLNALGQTVRPIVLPTAETTLDLTGLATGVYILRLTLDGQPVTRRVTVE